MPKKTLVLFGTRHYRENDIPPEIRNALALIIDQYEPQIVLEEWSESEKRESGASAVCRDKNARWESIGTPASEEFETYNSTSALDFPSAADVFPYGPIINQERREKVMCENIARSMSSYQVGVVVVGLAHLHSMFVKLSNGFEMEGYSYRPEFF